MRSINRKRGAAAPTARPAAPTTNTLPCTMPVPTTFPPECITAALRDPGVEILPAGSFGPNVCRVRAVVMIGGVPVHETDAQYADTSTEAAERAHQRAESWLKREHPDLHAKYTARK